MPDSPYAPPGSRVSDPAEPPRAKPRSVRIAVGCLWTVLVLAAFAVTGAGAFYSAAAAWHVDPVSPPAPVQQAQGVAPVPDRGETLHYTSRVTDKHTGKPIAGAAVVVRSNLAGSAG